MKTIGRFIRGANGPTPAARRWSNIGLALVLLSAALHYGLQSAGAPIWVWVVVEVIIIAALGVATVNWFRALLRADEERIKKSPKPW